MTTQNQDGQSAGVDSSDLLEMMCAGLAEAVGALYKARNAAAALHFSGTVEEIQKTINDVDCAWLQARRFLSSNVKADSSAAAD